MMCLSLAMKLCTKTGKVRGADRKMYGGVSFYICSSINFSLRTDLSIDQLENLCIEVQNPNSKPFLVATWYRPPDFIVEKFNFFETLIGKMDAENVEFYLLGDLNCNVGASVFDHPTRVLTFITGIFPTDWKCSKVIPLFKKEERRDLNNYLPISIIPVVAKVFERIIFIIQISYTVRILIF